MKKEKIIRKIKRIIDEWGGVSVNEIKNAECPIWSTYSKEGKALIETFNRGDVGITSYVNGIMVDEFDVEYDDLNKDTLSDILSMLEDYKVDMDKTMEHCQD